MKYGRKLIALCMLLTLIFTMMPQTCVQANAGQENVSTVQPRYSNLQDATLAFGVDSEGVACASIVCVYYESCTDYVQIRLQMQRYTEEDGWTSIYTTIANFHERPAYTGFTRSVTKGYTYRTVATMDFYKDGTIVETVVLPSVTDSY